MNRIFKLFRKDKNSKFPTSEKENFEEKKQIFDFFQKGKDSYLNNDLNDALLYFDKAFELKFTEYCLKEEANIYDLRGACLERLEFHYDAISDFNKSISLSPNDCDKYFCRSRSKLAILDYEGAVLDIEKAIEVSQVDNEHNKIFNEQAYEQGYKNGAAEFYQLRLQMVKLDLEYDLTEREKIENASSPNEKDFRREFRLTKILPNAQL